MIEFVQGDIFDIPADIRVNTVNCVGVMGAGVALAFKQRYPEMFKDYKRACKNEQIRPGKMHVWKTLEGVWIINFPTKRHWKEPSRYEDIEIGLDDLRLYLDSVGPVTVALPALGCGNGGLDWGHVSDLIRQKLAGVNANVYVFEPAASRRAGKNVVLATDDERKFTEQLGYDLLQSEQLPSLNIFKSVNIMGTPKTLSRRWIALLPSNNPNEREIHALQAISRELASLKVDVVVALVYSSKISEEIANIFTQQGVNTVLILPFGVLTQKTIGKRIAACRSDSLTLISTAAASEKWSRQLFAQSMDILKFNAGAALLSDPEPDWLSNKELSKWGGTPISYVKYEATFSSLREALERVGAKSIGRRGEKGAPNLDFLLTAFGDALTTATTLTDLTADDTVSDIIETKKEKNKLSHPECEVFRLNTRQKSQAELQLLFEAILRMNIEEVSLRLPTNTNENDIQYLFEFGFNRIEG